MGDIVGFISMDEERKWKVRKGQGTGCFRIIGSAIRGYFGIMYYLDLAVK